MTSFGFSFSKKLLTAVSLISLTAVTGCTTVDQASVEAAKPVDMAAIQETPEEAQTPVQSVVPALKPGTQIAAYVTPSTPDQGAVAAVETLAANGSTALAAEQAVTEATTTQTVPAVTPVETASADVQTETASVTDAAPTYVSLGYMDSDFDTGEPMGLENLVARNMIVPMSKPQTTAVGYAATPATASAFSTGLRSTSSRPDLDRLIKQYADLNGIPEELVHRVVKRESTYNPRAYSKGNYGLMQIRYNTARGLGYEGPAEGLFDAETNLKYATKYLRGAWLVADGKHDGAVRLYASGYYYHAKKKGMLEEAGLK